MNADNKFEKYNKPKTDMIDNAIPKIKACFLFNLPVGIGLKQVLVINLSKSASYHILRAPAAPAPIATKKIEIIDFKKETLPGAVNKPTAHVKITNDITRGFISNKKDFKFINLLSKTDFLLMILLVTFMLHLGR